MFLASAFIEYLEGIDDRKSSVITNGHENIYKFGYKMSVKNLNTKPLYEYKYSKLGIGERPQEYHFLIAIASQVYEDSFSVPPPTLPPP